MPIEIQVTDPFEKIIYTKDDISQGKFAFTTATTGDYIVCFHNKGGLEFMVSKDFSATKIDPDLSIADTEESKSCFEAWNRCSRLFTSNERRTFVRSTGLNRSL
mmetsp:Transcript_3167/g.10680  ORF Transcript_3167/g.10680 Transcript_3167/m.10680 type:complete len:104 (-) Transcript_3167:2065-2376(-)